MKSITQSKYILLTVAIFMTQLTYTAPLLVDNKGSKIIYDDKRSTTKAELITQAAFIDQADRRFEQKWQQKDPQGIANEYTENGGFMKPGVPARIGRSEITQEFKTSVNAVDSVEFVQDELEFLPGMNSAFQRAHMTAYVNGRTSPVFVGAEKELDMIEFSQLMKPIFTAFKQRHPDTRIMMESGRYIMATAGSFVCKISSVKMNYGEEFLVTDGGTHCHLSAVGIGAVVQRNFPIENLSSTQSLITKIYNVAGVLYNPEDLLARKLNRQKVKSVI